MTLSLSLSFLKNPKECKHNGGFVEAIIVILVLVLSLVIVGELSGVSQLSSRLECGVCFGNVCARYRVGLFR